MNVSTNEPSRSEVTVGVVRRDSMSIPEAPTVTSWLPTDVLSVGSNSGVDEHAAMAMTTATVPTGILRTHKRYSGESARALRGGPTRTDGLGRLPAEPRRRRRPGQPKELT